MQNTVLKNLIREMMKISVSYHISANDWTLIYVETRRADGALNKLKPCFSLKSKFYKRISSNTHMCYKKLPWLFNNNV